MKKMTWILIIAVVAVVAVPFGVYGMDYMDKYEVNVSMVATSDALGVIYLNDMETEIDEMDWLSFWDILKGHSTGGDKSDYYFIAIAITNKASGDTVTDGVRIDLMPGQIVNVTIEILEVLPGDSSMRVYVDSLFTGGIIYDKTTDIVVG